MLEFFRGWKRKVGCVTLVIACLLTMAWQRSESLIDDLVLPQGDRHALYQVRSVRGDFWICSLRSGDHLHIAGIAILDRDGDTTDIGIWYSEVAPKFFWSTYASRSKEAGNVEQLRSDPNLTGWNILGIGREVKVRKIGDVETIVFYIFPYWSIVLPFTLVSAWLLLSRPRTKNEPAIEEN